MTKPISRCVDIRQEHPLLDKFKELFDVEFGWKVRFYSQYYGKQNNSVMSWNNYEPTPMIISLDQRREWFGKEYYEGQTIEKESVRDGRLDFISDFKSKLDELNKDIPGSYYGGDSLNLIQVMNILSNYNIVKK